MNTPITKSQIEVLGIGFTPTCLYPNRKQRRQLKNQSIANLVIQVVPEKTMTSDDGKNKWTKPEKRIVHGKKFHLPQYQSHTEWWKEQIKAKRKN